MILLIPLIIALGFAGFLAKPLIEDALVLMFSALGWVLKLVLMPIDLIIAEYVPDLSNGINAINDMFAIANQYIAYILNATLITHTAMTLIIAYYTLWGAIAFTSWSIKLLLKWKVALLG